MKKQFTTIFLLLGLVPAILMALCFSWVLLRGDNISLTATEIYLLAGGAIVIIVATVFVCFALVKTLMETLNYVTGSLTFIAKDIQKGDVDLTKPLAPPGTLKIGSALGKAINMMLSEFSATLRQFSESTNNISTSRSKL
ncbi:MAG: hypothetical protein Q9N32_01310 [Gammaproteobacteria bacterium]|nr:hypothetical protein [Gammaproteobacteria bacterium]